MEAERRRGIVMATLETTELPIAVIDLPERTVRLVNEAWRQLFVLKSGAGPLSRVPAEVLAQIDRIAKLSVQRVDIPELALATTGRPEHVALTARPLHSATGTIIGAVLACADITDEVVARDLDLDRDALVWGGPMNGETDYVNGAWTRYTGGVPVTGPWIHPDDRSRCAHAFVEAARQRASSEIEVRLRRGDGEYRWHRVRFGKDGTRWHGFAHDIHDARNVAVERDELGVRERAARADAEQANRLKDQFLAAVSHELRAPLTTMLLWEKVLRGTKESDELRTKALEVIRLSVQAQSRIVGDLLDVSRAASGKLHVDLRPVEIATVIDEAITAAAPSAVAKQLTLVREGSTLLGDVQGDAARLRQVLENLLSNAIKFTEPGGRVTVTASRHGRTVVISIVDTGRGIAAEFMPRLFEPFTQVEDELTEARRRTGPRSRDLEAADRAPSWSADRGERRIGPRRDVHDRPPRLAEPARAISSRRSDAFAVAAWLENSGRGRRPARSRRTRIAARARRCVHHHGGFRGDCSRAHRSSGATGTRLRYRDARRRWLQFHSRAPRARRTCSCDCAHRTCVGARGSSSNRGWVRSASRKTDRCRSFDRVPSRACDVTALT